MSVVDLKILATCAVMIALVLAVALPAGIDPVSGAFWMASGSITGWLFSKARYDRGDDRNE